MSSSIIHVLATRRSQGTFLIFRDKSYYSTRSVRPIVRALLSVMLSMATKRSFEQKMLHQQCDWKQPQVMRPVPFRLIWAMPIKYLLGFDQRT